MRVRVVLLFICVLFISGCPSDVVTPIVAPVPRKAASPEAEILYREATNQYDAKNLDEADRMFAEFERQYGNDPLMEQVLLFRGKIAMEQRRPDDAKPLFERLLQLSSASSHGDYASMYLGLIAFQQGNAEDAVHYLQPLAGRFADRNDNLAVLRTLWESYFNLEQYSEMLVWMEEYLQAGPAAANRDVAQTTARNVVGGLTLPELQRVATQMNQKGVVWTLVTAQIARIQLESQQFDAAMETAESIRDSGMENASLVADVLELVESRNRVDMTKVGCLLPLSGKMRLVGEEAKKGILLASGQGGFARGNAPLTVILRDTANTEQTLEATVEELVLTQQVAAIVGPMDAVVSRQAAQKAQQLGVPMIVLSTDDRLGEMGNFIFRKFASNQSEIEALVRAAGSELQLREISANSARYATLYPENGYGKLMNRIFEQQLETRSRAVASVPFPPEMRDFNHVAISLTQREFDVLLLPMTSQQLALAAPALAAAGIWPSLPGTDDESSRTAVYLVPSVGYSPSLVSRAGRYLQGAYFVRDFTADTESSSVSIFIREFSNTYKTPPSVYAGYGYDAMLLIQRAIQSGVTSRSALRTWLDEVVSAAGLVYPFEGFDSEGNAVALPMVRSLSGTELR